MENQESRDAVESNEVSILEMIDTLHRWWLRIVILALITSFAGYMYAVRTYVPVYTATAMMIINSKQVKIVGQELVVSNDVAMSQRLVDTYSVILRSKQIANLVAEDLGLDIPPDLIRAGISVAPANDTEVLYVMVSNTNPRLAADIANSLMKVAPEIISQTVEVGSVKVVDYAEVPKYPQPPKKVKYTVIGAIIGIMLGAGLALLFHFLDNTLKNDLDIEEKIGITLLGSIPKMKVKKNRNKDTPNIPIVNNEWANDAFKESYKAARTNLLYTTGIHNVKTLLITSSLPNEGKTTVAINMAIVMSQLGKSVLLVNCDLRKPSISKKLWLSCDEKKGLPELLNGKCSFKECIVRLPKTNVDVLPSQKTDKSPSELLGSESTKALLREMKAKYDYVILDTPPAYLVTDAAVLSVLVDGIVFVVKQGFAAANIISNVVRDLNKLNNNILGCIFNNIDYKISGAYYKNIYYKRYYNHYYQGSALINARVKRVK